MKRFLGWHRVFQGKSLHSFCKNQEHELNSCNAWVETSSFATHLGCFVNGNGSGERKSNCFGIIDQKGFFF